MNYSFLARLTQSHVKYCHHFVSVLSIICKLLTLSAKPQLKWSSCFRWIILKCEELHQPRWLTLCQVTCKILDRRPKLIDQSKFPFVFTVSVGVRPQGTTTSSTSGQSQVQNLQIIQGPSGQLQVTLKLFTTGITICDIVWPLWKEIPQHLSSIQFLVEFVLLVLKYCA
jgi:hypothetical protein